MSGIREIIGAGPPTGTIQVTLFIPSVDRSGAGIDQARWREDALSVLGRLFRGATAFPPGRGVWRDDARGGALVFDDTVLVTAYVSDQDFTENALRDLRSFLHRLGRETNQGEVGVIIAGNFYGITAFDDPKESQA